MAKSDILSFEEIEFVVPALMQVGVRRVRLTGGEPTVRRISWRSSSASVGWGLRTYRVVDQWRAPGSWLRRCIGPACIASTSASIPCGPSAARVTRRGHLDRVFAGFDAGAPLASVTPSSTPSPCVV